MAMARDDGAIGWASCDANEVTPPKSDREADGELVAIVWPADDVIP